MAETIYNSFGDLPAENNAQKWRNFFSQNIGMFLRNAVIYEYGMAQFYIDSGILIEPDPSITGSMNSGYGNYGIHPTAAEIIDGSPGFANWGTVTTLLDSIFPIYGKFIPDVEINDESPYWILIGDKFGRLGWLESDSVNHDANYLTTLPPVNRNAILPDRPYQLQDLNVIIGE